MLSLKTTSKQEILEVIEEANAMKKSPPGPILKGKILCNCFFEPSTRTALSFASAMKRLGGEVIGFSDSKTTSMEKGESLEDTIKVIGSYADVLVLRHPQVGAALLASKMVKIPVINAGDGAGEHPTQTLTDLFTLKECQGRLDGLTIVLLGDLKYSRTIHSLIHALSHFQVKLFLVSPEALGLPQELMKPSFTIIKNYQEVIEEADLLYVTRVQKERFIQKELFSYSLSLSSLKNVKPHFKIFHPLPRCEELPNEIDDTPFAHYFTQAENGLYLRMALLKRILT